MQRAKRKLEHIQYALELGDGPAATHLADLRFLHNCLPEINPADFVLSVEILGKRLRLPFFIDAITGSTDAVTEINRKLAQVAEKTGFAPQYIEEQGEYAPGKTGLSYVFAPPGGQDTMNGLNAADYLWIMQRQAVLELAEKGSCVIVGRCADYILRENPDCLHVFIHADTKFRAERIVRLYGESEKSPELRLKDKDARRSANYKHFTGREWGQCRNYHLSLDSGVIGADNCVDLIVRLAAGKMLLTEE